MEALNINVLDSEEYTLVWQELMKMYADHGNCMGNQYGGSGAMHSLALAKPTSSDGDNGKTHGSTKAGSDEKRERLLLRSPSRSPPDVLLNMSWAEGLVRPHMQSIRQRCTFGRGKRYIYKLCTRCSNSEEKKSPSKQSSRVSMGFSGRFFGLTKSKKNLHISKLTNMKEMTSPTAAL